MRNEEELIEEVLNGCYDSFETLLHPYRQLILNIGYRMTGKEISLTLIDTTLHLKSGERTVVGVSKLDNGGKALILILSGKVIK